MTTYTLPPEPPIGAIVWGHGLYDPTGEWREWIHWTSGWSTFSSDRGEYYAVTWGELLAKVGDLYDTEPEMTP